MRTYLNVKTSTSGVWFINCSNFSRKESLRKVERNKNLVNFLVTLSLKWTICKMEKKLHVHGKNIDSAAIDKTYDNTLCTDFVLYSNRWDREKSETVFWERRSDKSKTEKSQPALWKIYLLSKKKFKYLGLKAFKCFQKWNYVYISLVLRKKKLVGKNLI